MNTYLLDTNILIRFFTGDHPIHSPQSLKLIREAVQEKIYLYIEPLVLAECVFVLTKVYQFTKEDVVDKLYKLLEFSGIQSQDKHILAMALQIYAKYNIDFVDAYLTSKTQLKEKNMVVTYNVKDFKKADAFYITPDDPLLYPL